LTLPEWRVVGVFVLVAMALRIPFLAIPLSIDEGGYAFVASQWGVGDGGLYGGQWVDRPPLLIALYALVISLAGDLGVRLLGCVAAALTIVACMRLARRVAGRTAMTCTGVAVVTLTSSTLMQSTMVNAELPASALVALSMWLAVRAIDVRTRYAWLSAFGAGVSGSGAILVKQSFADGFVFALALLVAALVLSRRERGELRAALHRRLGVVLAAGTCGVAFAAVLLVAWAELRGPGIGTLLDALYGFRVEARDVVSDPQAQAPRDRAVRLGMLVVLNGTLALFAYAWLGMSRIAGGRQSIRSSLDPLLVRACAVALCVLGVWGVFAISQGGNWWRHYLIQLVPMLAVSTGIVIGGVRDRARSRVASGSMRAAFVVSVVALVAWVGMVGWTMTFGMYRTPAAVGDWLREAAGPDDTAIVTWGHPNVLHRSGMSSPYPFSWSLPIRVRDPKLAELRRVVRGPEAPTWIVEWSSFGLWDLDDDRRFRQLVKQRYERVSSVCGKDVYRLRSAGSGATPVPRSPSKAACGGDVGRAVEDARLW
jgi:hypothetical protein